MPLSLLSHLAIATAAIAAQPDAAHASSLDAADCAALKIDFIHMLPEMIEPKSFVPPDPPFKDADLKLFAAVDAADPNNLCHYHDANVVLPHVSRNRTVFFGDSITEYWGLADHSLFSGETLNRGISSQNTSQMLLRFQQDVIALRPRTVHILAGINDAMNPNGTISTRSNIISMVELAKAHGIRVILGTLTPADRFWLAPDARLAPFVKEHNRWLRAYARKAEIELGDYYAALATQAGTMPNGSSNDGLHPNRIGYAPMSVVARRALRNVSNVTVRSHLPRPRPI